jgi:hypothetical protein
MFSGWIGQLVNARCRRDPGGRLVFLPQGRRKPGYYLDSDADYQKVKAPVAIYTLASMLFQVLGSTAAIVIAIGASTDHPASLANKLEFVLMLYVLSAFTLQWLPMWLLWRLYRALLPELCASLQPIPPESMSDLQTLPNPMRRGSLIVVVLALFVMAVILFLVSRPQCSANPTANVTQGELL